MVGVVIALPKKMVITTRPTVATARGTKLKPVQHSLVFREYSMSQRSSTAVHLQPIYEAIKAYLSEFYFFIPSMSEPIQDRRLGIKAAAAYIVVF